MYKTIALCLIVLVSSSCSGKNKLEETVSEENLNVIPLELTTHLGDQQRFVSGDEIQFLLSLGQDAYIYMYYIDASDNITQILPNENQKSNFYRAGYFLTIPEYENLYRFTISKPFGKETIWVIASDQSISPGKELSTIEAIKNKIKHTSTNAYGEYALRITTAEK